MAKRTKRLVQLLVLTAIAVAGFTAAMPGTVGALIETDNPGASHEKVTICHSVEGKGETGFGYNIITVNFNSIADAQSVGGHGDHEGDIIPPYTYTDPQGTVNYPGKGDQSRLPGCGPPDDTTTTDTTTTDTTDTTDTTTTTDTTDTTTTTQPPGERCPPGQGPFAGKDGEPGNQECCPDANNDQRCDVTETQPPVTTTTEPPVTTTEPPATTTQPPIVEPTPTPPVTKPKPKPQTETPKKKTPPKKKLVPPPPCPPASPYEGEGPCAPMGSG